MSRVFLVPGRSADPTAAVAAQVDALWQHAGFDEIIGKGDLAALKLHVGEPGTKTFVRPAIAAALVRRMRAAGAQPFLTDTAVLYRSPRDNAVGHARVAQEHGFGFTAMDAPFVPADGLNGTDEVEVEVAGQHFTSVFLASGIMKARSMVMLTHVTGHLGIGFAATLKNLGMGCSSKKGKLRQHHGQQPHIDDSKCTGCGTCVDWCPADAITLETRARLDPQKCISCGECLAVCLEGAVQFDWSVRSAQLQERIVEYAAGMVRRRQNRIAYVTVAQDITKDCDCLGVEQPPLLSDIGMLASRDPVALDQAVMDLIHARAGRTLESMSYPRHDGSRQLAHAEALGLGTRQVELVTLAAV